MALRDNLISWWELNEESGTRVDAHGSNDLSDNNTVTSGTGKVGDAALFASANSEYLSITDATHTGLDITGDLTMALWVNFNTDGGTQTHMSKWLDGTNAGHGYYMRSSGSSGDNKIGWGFGDGTSTNQVDNISVTIATGTWYHFAVVYDAGASIKTYWDGSEVNSNTTSIISSIQNNDKTFVLGSHNEGTNQYTDGLIDEAGIWSRALTASEISELYNSGSGLSYADTAAATFTPKVIGPF